MPGVHRRHITRTVLPVGRVAGKLITTYVTPTKNWVTTYKDVDSYCFAYQSRFYVHSYYDGKVVCCCSYYDDYLKVNWCEESKYSWVKRDEVEVTSR